MLLYLLLLFLVSSMFSWTFIKLLCVCGGLFVCLIIARQCRNRRIRNEHVKHCIEKIAKTPITLRDYFQRGFNKGRLAVLKETASLQISTCKHNALDNFSDIEHITSFEKQEKIDAVGYWLGFYSECKSGDLLEEWDGKKFFNNFANHFLSEEWAMIRNKIRQI